MTVSSCHRRTVGDRSLLVASQKSWHEGNLRSLFPFPSCDDGVGDDDDDVSGDE
jgi:hypothetical protein